MNVAITVWENRVSPVFDSSHMLLIAEIEDSHIKNRTYLTFDPEMPSYLIENLNRMGVSVFICGAVSEMPAHMIDASGIELIPFVAGHTEKVLKSFAQDDAIHPEFFMPGCDQCPRPRKKSRSRLNRMDKRKGKDLKPNKLSAGTRGRGVNRKKGKERQRTAKGKQDWPMIGQKDEN